MKILVKWPTRSRPSRFSKALRAYQELRTTDQVDFLITIDMDDKEMTHPRILEGLRKWGNLRYDIIYPCGKIGAINSGLDAVCAKYDIIVLASDDMIPCVVGWDKRIIDDMAKHFPDTDGVLWYNDGYTGQQLNTLTIMGTKYYRRFGYIYHPDYVALWCDNELMDVANRLGKQKYFEDVIIRHEHPMNGHGRVDSLNIRDSRYYEIDKKTYEDRKSRGFDLMEYIDSDDAQPRGDVQEADIGHQPADKPRRVRKSGAGSKPVGQSKAKHWGKA
jgi:hypothetical protein